MTAIVIREASLCDISIIKEIAEISFRHTYADILSPEQMEYMMDWMYSDNSLAGQIRDGQRFFIAYDITSGKPLGYVSVERQGEKLFHLQKLYVLPGYQGEGIGEKLFSRVREYALSLDPDGCTIELNVNRKNKAYGFYVRMGMRKVREGDFPIGEGFYMNDYIMAIDL